MLQIRCFVSQDLLVRKAIPDVLTGTACRLRTSLTRTKLTSLQSIIYMHYLIQRRKEDALAKIPPKS
jgi:hypothetical protein